MKLNPKVAVATAIVGLVGFGGVSLAYAADSPTTTTPKTQTAPPSGDKAPSGKSDANCPNMGGESGATPSSQPTAGNTAT